MYADSVPQPRRRLGRNLLFLALFAVCVVLLIVLRTQGFLRPPGQAGGIHVSASGLIASNHVSIRTNEAPPEDTKAEEKAILEILADQEKAWNQGDLEAFMVGYWKSPDLSFYSGRDKQRGWQETYDRYKKRYQGEGKEMGKLAFTELQVEPIASGVAIVRGRWKLEKKAETMDGLFTLLVRKLPEGWRIVHDHTSMGEPPAKKSNP